MMHLKFGMSHRIWAARSSGVPAPGSLPSERIVVEGGLRLGSQIRGVGSATAVAILDIQ
jgi:hypothetical protein